MSEVPHTGDVYWCEDYPGLHGHASKDRYAVVISPPNKCPDARGEFLVVPTSSSSLSKYSVALPSKAENPQTTSGLPGICKAVCDEYRFVTRNVLTRWVGDLRTPAVTALQEKVCEVITDRKGARAKNTQGDVPKKS